MSVTVIVFAKAPVPGLAKTRLAPALGADGAAALAARMLEHTVGQAVAAGLGPVEICAVPDVGHPLFERLAREHGARLSVQDSGDLGERMHRAFERTLAPGQPALLVGTDAPALDAAVLRQAATALAGHDAVFVPVLDGGYVLVGLHRADGRCFSGITWSTPRVMQDTRDRLLSAGQTWAELPPLADVDEPADLRHVPPAWLAALAKGSP
jgi:rSAM/selenodomain-associated transferase 1